VDAETGDFMFPAFGAMVGIYIITRMLDLLSGEKKTVIKVFACITIVVTLISVIDILNAGSRAAASLSNLSY
jgi:hypothetical protein